MPRRNNRNKLPQEAPSYQIYIKIRNNNLAPMWKMFKTVRKKSRRKLGSDR